MDEMPHIIHEYVIVVSVFHLEDVLEKGVSGQTFCEISNCTFPILAIDLFVNDP